MSLDAHLPTGTRERRTRDLVRDRAWLASAAILATLTFLTHGANFTFTLLGARLLEPGDFATLTAMLGIVLIGMAPGMALQALTAAGVLGGPARVQPVVVRRLAAVIAGIVALTMVVLGPALGTWNPVSVLAIAAGAGLLPLTAANEGVLQGRGHFTWLGCVLATGALGKLAVGATGMAVTNAVWAAAIGIAAGYALQLALSRRLVRRGTSPPNESSTLPGSGAADDPEAPSAQSSASSRDATSRAVPPATVASHHIPGPVLSAVVMMGLLLVVIHLDAVMARLLLDDLPAGLYAVGATAMRIVFWAPQFAILLLFPILVTDPRRRIVAAAIAALGAVGLVGTVLAGLVGPSLVPFVFGQEYAAIGTELWRFAWLGTAAVGLQVLCLSDLATGRREALWLLVATIATVVSVLVAMDPDTPTAVVTTVATIVTAYVAVGTVRRAMHTTPARDLDSEEAAG